ncbi:ABC-2 transporter permease [Bifidobacterium sp. B4107]|uniref:ABC-2 transporter permease n=1 Tax=unclassified Bifidobacterium TaxID=2608897 RepID=UPI00226B2E29|nr:MULTISPECIES: ABC-2 transporter permease [unclassified Bifidobacterium]MCX8648100.1 ABC-2 transporter permease [Bifidobacterium sp. B4107]MCX8652457.1 ABC-2 transporter permease [Bifidobacterium sp. B4111]MCX8658853.1 ABC-2 transporter permease [Bifidobacterium sp. B4114]MCX8687706.1 ABC-2 transporter permease [Bifidobacterium sp. B4142]
MKAIAKQIRLDMQRFSGTGRPWVGVLIYMSVPCIGILLNLVMALTGNDGEDARTALTGAVAGMGIGLIVGQVFGLFADFNNMAIRLNGLLPITRDHQVFGRYAAVILLVLVQSCGYAVFFFYTTDSFLHGRDHWHDTVLFALGLFLLESLLFAVATPLFYWLEPVKAMIVFLALLGLVPIMVLIGSLLPVDWGTFWNSIMQFLTSDLWRPVLLGLALILAVEMVSIVLSRKVYVRKEI